MDAVFALDRILRDRTGMAPGYAKWVNTPVGAEGMVAVESGDVEGSYPRAKKAKATIDPPPTPRCTSTARVPVLRT